MRKFVLTALFIMGATSLFAGMKSGNTYYEEDGTHYTASDKKLYLEIFGKLPKEQPIAYSESKIIGDDRLELNRLTQLNLSLNDNQELAK